MKNMICFSFSVIVAYESYMVILIELFFID